MLKWIYSIVIFFVCSLSFASESDKTKFCPSVSNIFQYNINLGGYNFEGKWFSSEGPACAYCTDVYLKPLKLLIAFSKYDELTKILHCVYLVETHYFTDKKHFLKTLYNRGDY